MARLRAARRALNRLPQIPRQLFCVHNDVHADFNGGMSATTPVKQLILRAVHTVPAVSEIGERLAAPCVRAAIQLANLASDARGLSRRRWGQRWSKRGIHIDLIEDFQHDAVGRRLTVGRYGQVGPDHECQPIGGIVAHE